VLGRDLVRIAETRVQKERELRVQNAKVAG
jgi:hypothetical protein